MYATSTVSKPLSRVSTVIVPEAAGVNEYQAVLLTEKVQSGSGSPGSVVKSTVLCWPSNGSAEMTQAPAKSSLPEMLMGPGPGVFAGVGVGAGAGVGTGPLQIWPNCRSTERKSAKVIDPFAGSSSELRKHSWSYLRGHMAHDDVPTGPTPTNGKLVILGTMISARAP